MTGETTIPLSAEEMIEEVGKHRDAGVTVTQVAPPKTESLQHFHQWMDWFAVEVMPHCA